MERSAHPSLSRLEFVNLRSNLDCVFKPLFLVLRDSILEYYESESAYLTKEEGGMKGSISIKNGVKITLVGNTIDKKLLSTINKILIDKLSIRSFCY